MPRAKKTEDSAEIVVTKAKSSTAVKKATTRKKTSATKPVVKVVPAVSELIPVEASTVTRKAPTSLTKTPGRSTKSLVRLISIISLIVIIFVSGVVIGLSDKGQIDVVAIVNERNEKVSRGEVRDEATGDTVTRLVPVSGTSELPNGGLVPSGPATTSVPPATTTSTTSTATSSDVMSSSTTPDLVEELEATSTLDTTNEESGQTAETATTS